MVTPPKVVFVTEGEVSWVDPIESFLPEAVHVRQFHSENCRGLIYVHLLQVFPFLWKKVRKRRRSEIRSFFRGEVATMERIREVAVGPKGIFLGEPVVISYKDRKGRRTRRMIEPLKIETDPYSGVRRIESFCYLRQEGRTFLLERVTDAIPADTELSVISGDGL
ncbi:hypothetical protein AKJ40_04885 [candidate division MSBL1 archaeon SCGC-AAA259M10]|uniref:WYL domain-containing protein n=1 Tax=candidate division MSBL1 archaeon SCGC-AAA259M10 TaxID=1698270 RepID=A0A133UVI1_9EURY|nr:hypothetical protein AKJ40_04885 [candidate division MSBL1 archaeon SCGC-AAA259M10]